MKARITIVCCALFGAGLAGGWMLGGRKTASVTKRIEMSPKIVSEVAGHAPEPSGLPGDTIHLTTATDVRVLRAAWEDADGVLREKLADRWLEIDPADGIRFLLVEQVNGEPRSKQHGDQIAEEWGKRDGAAFLSFASQFDRKTLEFFSAGFWESVRSQFAQDTDALVNFWKSAPPALRGQMQYIFFNELFKKDLPRALAETEHLSPQERAVVWSAAHEVKGTDVEPVLRAMLRLDGSNVDSNRLISLLQSMYRNSPALEEITLSLPPGAARSSGCRCVIDHLSKDPEAALTWLELHDPTNENRCIVARALLEKDLARAMEIGGRNLTSVHSVGHSNSETDRFQDELQTAINVAAEKDWDATAELVLNSPSQQLRAHAIKGLAAALDYTGDSAIATLEQLGHLIGNARLPQNCLGQLSFKGLDPDQTPVVTQWLQQQPESIRDQLLDSLTDQLGGNEEAQKTPLLAQFPPSPVRTERLIQSTSDWAAREPQAAADFVLTLPPGTDRDYAILNTAIAWHRNAPEAAQAWAAALPESAAKLKVLENLRLAQ